MISRDMLLIILVSTSIPSSIAFLKHDYFHYIIIQYRFMFLISVQLFIISFTQENDYHLNFRLERYDDIFHLCIKIPEDKFFMCGKMLNFNHEGYKYFSRTSHTLIRILLWR